MPRALVPAPDHLPDQLRDLALEATAYAKRAISPASKRVYAAAWVDFRDWCAGQGLDALPAAPETIGLYLTDRARSLKVSSLGLRLVAITRAHRLADLVLNTRHPAIRDVLAGIKRVNTIATTRKAPLLPEHLRAIVATLPATATGDRDRAILLLGFAAALRRSEIVALDVDDTAFVAEGLTITLRRRKTDQEGAGTVIGVHAGEAPATCPVGALRAWMAHLGREEGPLFVRVRKGDRVTSDRLTDRSVANLVKAMAARIGLDATTFSGHSLRAGFATTAARAGVEERHIMRQTGHKSERMVRTYIRDGALFRDNASAKVGL